MLKNISIGVISTVLAAIILNQFFGLDESGRAIDPGPQPSTEISKPLQGQRSSALAGVWATYDGSVVWQFYANGTFMIDGQMMGLRAEGRYQQNGINVSGHHTATLMFNQPAALPCQWQAVLNGNILQGQIQCQGEMVTGMLLQRRN